MKLAADPPVDISAVPEPPGLVAIGRVARPDVLVAVAGSWTHLPLPGGSELVRAVTDEAVAEVIDLSQPVDGAVSVVLSRRGFDPVAAFSVGVKSFEQARSKLGAKHKLVPGTNGSVKVLGMGSGGGRAATRPAEDEGDGDGDEGFTCVLAHGALGGRLVCGEAPAVETLAPYLARTMPREKWTSDLHMEMRPEPVRVPLMEFRSSLPILARSLFGSSSSAVRELAESSAGELVDIVNDTQKVLLDAQIAEAGLVATTRFEFQSAKSTFARALTNADHAGAPPPAFAHLPAESDLAFFGDGSDPKLFEHPREILGNVLLEGAEASGMPDAERKSTRDLLVDRMTALFTGPGIYAKGHDGAALDRALKAYAAVKPDAEAAELEARRAVAEQAIGWHLFQTSEPIAKVGPILKDGAGLWNRPAFAKWMEGKTPARPRIRLAPMPGGVTLPKDTVHLEITLVEEESAEPKAGPARGSSAPPLPSADRPRAKSFKKTVVVHLFAVPDGGSTWLAFGLDPKLVAQKAAASLTTAPDTNTLGKVAGHEALAETKVNSGGLANLRGFLVLATLDPRKQPSPFGLVPSLPGKGTAPILFTGRAETASPTARAGASVGTVRISRAVIEDAVKLVMSSMR